MDRHIHGIRQLLDTEPCAQMPLQIIQDRPLAVKSQEGLQIPVAPCSLFKKIIDQACKYRLQIKKAADRFLPYGFQQDTGMGLKEYMSRQLAQRARQMLGHTDMPVWEVAEALGFTDPYYFSRFFKKYEKLSPREYRKLQF